MHIVLIACLKIFYDSVPGVSQETSWTLTNISYMLVSSVHAPVREVVGPGLTVLANKQGSYIMFHWVQGIPFEFNSGAYDKLNMWEQIDNGDQYTPAKKFLLAVPIVLCVFACPRESVASAANLRADSL